MSEKEPLKISIPASEIRDWFDQIEKGITSKVNVDPDDHAKMIKDGFVIRGEVLKYLKNRLFDYLHYE